MSNKNLKALGRALRGLHRQPPLKGWASYGGTTKATLYIGATTGLRGGPVAEGAKLSQRTITTFCPLSSCLATIDARRPNRWPFPSITTS